MGAGWGEGGGTGRKETTKMMNKKRNVTIVISENFEKKECCEQFHANEFKSLDDALEKQVIEIN